MQADDLYGGLAHHNIVNSKREGDVIVNKYLDEMLDHANQHYPGDFCCDLFENSQWWGKRIHVCLENEYSPRLYSLGGTELHDKMTSYTCGRKVSFAFCKHSFDECMNGHGRMSVGAGAMRVNHSDESDNASGIIMQPYDELEKGAVVVFERHDCTQRHVAFMGPTDATYFRDYSEQDFHDRGITYENHVGSVMIP